MLEAKRSSPAAWLLALAMCLLCVVPSLIAAGGIVAAAGPVMTEGGPWRVAGAGVAAVTLAALNIVAARRLRRGLSC